MSIFSRSGRRSSRRAYAKRRTRFAPVCDGLEVRALLSTLVVTNNDDSGTGSLRQAILNAPSGATISFAKSLKGQIITLTSGVLSINQNLTIDGLGASELAVSGGGTSQVFNVASGANVTISGLTVTDGVNNAGEFGIAYGGGIVNAGNLTLQNSDVTANQAIGIIAAGGGIYNTGSLTLNYSDVTSNQVNSLESGGTGGGIENVTGATLTITHSIVSDNQVVTSTSLFVQGGGIDNQAGATATITDSTMTSNAAVGGPGVFDGGWGQGGAINDAGTLSISDSTLLDNQADGGANAGEAGLAFGGAIALSSSTVNNVPQVATLTMTNSVVSGNQAVGGTSAATGFINEGGEAFGGAIEVSTDSSVTLAGCTFSNNQALGGAGGFGTACGGAIDPGGTIAFSISGSSFTGNEAVGGAGPAVSSPYTIIADGASAYGGAIYSSQDPLVVTGTLFKNNQAIGGNALLPGEFSAGGEAIGGALNYSSESSTVSASLTGCTFAGNQAAGGTGDGGGEGYAEGGAIVVQGDQLPGVTTLSISKTAITNNVAVAGSDPTTEYAASAQGGGIYNEAAGITLSSSVLSGNQAIGAASSSPYGAGSAYGGGLNDDEGDVKLVNTPVSGNSATAGAGIASETGQGGSGGTSLGGGIFAVGDDISLTNSPVSGNSAVGGAGGGSGPGTDGGAGGSAYGGGIYTSGTVTYVYENGQFLGTDVASNVTATNSSFLGNSAQGGAGGAGGSSASGGAGGYAAGGAIYGDADSIISITGALVSLNSAVGGAGGAGSSAGEGGAGGDAQGGAFFVTGPDPYIPLPGATLDLSSILVTLNAAIGGGAGQDAPADSAGQGIGGGIYVVTGGAATLTDTLVFFNFASTSDPDIFGTTS